MFAGQSNTDSTHKLEMKLGTNHLLLATVKLEKNLKNANNGKQAKPFGYSFAININFENYCYFESFKRDFVLLLLFICMIGAFKCAC